MNTTATLTPNTTHMIVSPLVTVEILGSRSIGRVYRGRDLRQTATSTREYATYGLFHNRTRMTIAQVDGAWVELCGRCGGTGTMPYDVEAGVCFGCGGNGQSAKWFRTDDELTARMVAWGKSVRTASNKAQAKYETRQAEVAAWRTEHAELVAWAQGLTPTETVEDYDYEGNRITGEWCNQYGRRAGLFIRDLRDGSTLDKAKTSYLGKVMASALERKANSTARHAGDIDSKVTVTGTVATMNITETMYGTQAFVIVKGTGADEGITLKARTAGKTVWALEKGMAVSVKATVQAHEVYGDQPQDKVVRPVYTIL